MLARFNHTLRNEKVCFWTHRDNLFGFLRHFQHCIGDFTTGIFMGRGS